MIIDFILDEEGPDILYVSGHGLKEESIVIVILEYY